MRRIALIVFSYALIQPSAHAAVGPPSSCSPADAFVTGCTPPQWRGTDQGTIAEAHKNNYKNSIKPKYASYKTAYNNFIDRLRKKQAALVDAFVENVSLLRLRLQKWHETDEESFRTFHNSNDVASVYATYISRGDPMLIAGYNKIIYRIAEAYFRSNPIIYKSIRFDFWYKSFWPFWGGSGRWGGVPAYYHSDSINSIDQLQGFDFIRTASSSQSYFTQSEETYSDLWNNANTHPTVSTTKSDKHYRFVPSARIPDNIWNRLRGNSRFGEHLRKQVMTETLEETQSAVLSESLHSITNYITNVSDSEDYIYEALATQLEFSKIFLASNSLVPVTRIRNNNHDNKCLGVSGERITILSCEFFTRSLDWYIIKNNSNDGHQSFHLKNMATGECLAAQDSAHSDVGLESCQENQTNQIWQRRDSGLFTASADAFLTVSSDNDVGLLSGSETGEAARWQLRIPSGDNSLVRASSYDGKPKKRFLRNFLGIMYFLIYTQQHEFDSPARDFFARISGMSFFDGLPDRLKRIINLIASGSKSAHDALVDEDLALVYRDVKKALALTNLPHSWDDDNISIGDVHVYDNPYNGDSEVFVAKFNGNASAHYRYYPTDKSSNTWWHYVTTVGSRARLQEFYRSVGPHTDKWSQKTDFGNLHRYENPYEDTVDFFLSKIDWNPSDYNTYYPIDHTSNGHWAYLGGETNGRPAVVAILNAVDSIYLHAISRKLRLLLAERRDTSSSGISLSPATSGISSDISSASLDREKGLVAGIFDSLPNLSGRGDKRIAPASILINYAVQVAESDSALADAAFRLKLLREFNQWLGNRLRQLEDLNGGYTPTRDNVYNKWKNGDWNPPEGFEDWRGEFLRAHGNNEAEAISELNNPEFGEPSLPPPEEYQALVFTISNSAANAAFNAISTTASVIPAVTISTIASAGVSLFLIPL